MDNPNSYTLFAGQITTALPSFAGEAIDSLEGMLACTLVAQLRWGSGGTSISAVVQTSFDGGTTWFDVARFDFAAASAVKYANLSGLSAKAAAAYAALSVEGVNDGLLGPKMRAQLSSVGTYAGNTTLDLRMVAR
ncbi:hypothetical protein [Rhizobium sp. N324]|uniref:hypothetical protein n=1 Tax=Rhizobium sp. N324 TaxID=1703969 RepID=UPI0007E9CECE|nr:hypothetical protein [Rhizobium sp. N324]ANM12049.1 hypothetical protein AMK05_CH03700 [Rhizobium sp. N324]